MSEIKNGGLDLYGAGPFEQQQFGTAGVEEVNESESLPRFAHGFSPMIVFFSFFAKLLLVHFVRLMCASFMSRM